MIYGDGASTRSILRNFEERMENFEYNRATELVMDMVTEVSSEDNATENMAHLWFVLSRRIETSNKRLSGLQTRPQSV